MPGNYPKFDQKIQDQINLNMMQAAKTRPGMVLSFNKQSNTARVLLDDQFSENLGSVFESVPCPTSKGVQSVSPSVGTRCLIAFRDNNQASPYILNYFEDTSLNPSYMLNYSVNTGIPKFLVH